MKADASIAKFDSSASFSPLTRQSNDIRENPHADRTVIILGAALCMGIYCYSEQKVRDPMPIGILTNVCTVVIASLLGTALSRVFPRRVTAFMMEIFGFCSVTIGISAIMKMNSLTVVIISVLLGSAVGVLCRIDDGIRRGIERVTRRLCRSEGDDIGRTEMLCMIMVIVCFSGTGIFGALSEGLDGDSSFLMAKSVMDFFSILTFSLELGSIIALMAIPQLGIYLVLFFSAAVLGPILSPETIADFKATGGVLTLMIGYNLIASQNGLKTVKILNTVPALAFALVLSWITVRFAIPV